MDKKKSKKVVLANIAVRKRMCIVVRIVIKKNCENRIFRFVFDVRIIDG